MFESNRITQLFQIQYPIIQGGMIWASGSKLAAAVSNAGGLGLIGAGSMYPDVLREHIQKAKKLTDKPFGVNVPLLYPNVDEIMQIIVEEGVKYRFYFCRKSQDLDFIPQRERDHRSACSE
jgi:enoyl-[acyl-carrier protein] reductase II